MPSYPRSTDHAAMAGHHTCPAALQLRTTSVLWTGAISCLRGAASRKSSQDPPPPTQAATSVHPRAWWDLLRNDMLFSAACQPGGTGSPYCPHEGTSCLTMAHTQQKARNEVKRNSILMSSWIQLNLQAKLPINTLATQNVIFCYSFKPL